MLFSISEILKKADEAKSSAEKVKILQTFQNEVLKRILKCCFDPNVKFLVPKGPVEYERSRLVESHSVLYAQAKKLYIFIDGESPPNLTEKRRELLFREFLSSLDPKDAELMISVKDKKLPYKSLTKTVVKKAFPELFNEQE